MKKSKISKLMLMLAVVAIICCISSVNHATSNLNDLIGDGETKIDDIPTIPGDNSNTNLPTDDGNNVPNPPASSLGGDTNKNTTNNTNTALPKAGANDTLLWGLIAVSTIAAIYTYKKVRDYTN